MRFFFNIVIHRSAEIKVTGAIYNMTKIVGPTLEDLAAETRGPVGSVFGEMNEVA